jgi:protein ImuA
MSFSADALLSFGHAPLDERLGGGLRLAALHELHGPPDVARAVAVALLARCPRQGPLLWLTAGRNRTRPYGPGLAHLGLAAERVVLVRAPDGLSMLRAAADASACAEVAAVLMEAGAGLKAFDLTASRRLALAAARSGVLVLALRNGAAPASAALTRWQVDRLPSRPLEGEAPGLPAFRLELVRNRTGPAGFALDLEWNHERRCFQPPLPGGLAAPAPLGTAAPGVASAA